jgi:hypothetical protein
MGWRGAATTSALCYEAVRASAQQLQSSFKANLQAQPAISIRFKLHQSTRPARDILPGEGVNL